MNLNEGDYDKAYQARFSFHGVTRYVSRIIISNFEDLYFAQDGLLLPVAPVIPDAREKAFLAFDLIGTNVYHIGLSKLPTRTARKKLKRYEDYSSSSTIDRGVLPKTISRTSLVIWLRMQKDGPRVVLEVTSRFLSIVERCFSPQLPWFHSSTMAKLD